MTLLAQMKREISVFFYSPIAYVMLAGAMVLNGGAFLAIVDFLSHPMSPHGAAMQMLFGGTFFFWVVVLITTPLITMRCIAEEKHSGTLETLLTAPIDDIQVVVAKFLSACLFYIVLWFPTLAYPFFLSRYSDLDPGPILSGYLGTACVGMMFMSIGMFFSAVTRNQIVAALLSFAAVMVLFFVGVFEFLSPATSPDSVLGYMNLWSHMDDFGRGIVDTRRLVYYFSVTLFALFGTVQILQARRWRG